MISIVCVYNKESIFTDALLSGLKNQTAAYELIALDNTAGRFRSAAEAYNFGGARARGEYIMFIHQDMWLATRTWLEDAEGILGDLPSLGVAGVAGVFSMAKRVQRGEKGCSRIHFLRAPIPVELDIIGTVSEEVEALDECLLIVPRLVFDRLKFDEATFDGWDCYGADYCLCARDLGLKTYVIPAPSSHGCARDTYEQWEFKDLLKYQKRFYAKHGRGNETICTFMGDVDPVNLRAWARSRLWHSLHRRLVPDRVRFLGRELAGCDSVLDLNCSYRSLMGRFKFRVSFGLDSFLPYVQESRRRGFHEAHVVADVRSIPFKPESFDAVVALDTLDGLTKEEGTALLVRMEELARQKVIVTTRKHSEPGISFGYPVPERRSTWEAAELADLGFRVRGCDGEKELDGRWSALKYQPAILRRFITAFYQRALYHFPRSATQLMAVKHVGSTKRR
jgi:hypothetical protein